MPICMFASRHDGWVFGLTDNGTGSPLPPKFAPWQALGARVMSWAGGIDSESIVRAAISAQGRYLVHAGENSRGAH
jgi:hypothetical protein